MAAHTPRKKLVGAIPRQASAELDDLYQLACATLRSGDFSQAAAEFTRVLRQDPGCAGSLVGRATCYLNQSNFSAALADSTHAIAYDPHYAVAYYSRALVYMKLGDVSRALLDLGAAIRLDQKDWEYLLVRAQILEQQGEYEQAVLDVTSALELGGADGAVHLCRAQLFLRLYEYEAALLDCDTADRLGEQDAALFHARSIARFALDEFRLAEIDADIALSREPSPRTYLLRSTIRWHRGATEGALHDLDSALSLDPTLVGALIQRVYLLALMGQHYAAIAAASRALGQTDDPDVWLLRAQSYLAVGEDHLALHDLCHCLRLAPDQPDARRLRAQLLDIHQEWRSGEELAA